jgi:HEAT repeat protein
VDSDAGASVGGGVAEKDWSDRHNQSALDQPSPSSGKTTGDNSAPTPNIPHRIASELASPNPRVRYDALNYWETKGTQASIDPVFEAMEDEDPFVRAKATTIIEQRWEAEQERERG